MINLLSNHGYHKIIMQIISLQYQILDLRKDKGSDLFNISGWCKLRDNRELYFVQSPTYASDIAKLSHISE